MSNLNSLSISIKSLDKETLIFIEYFNNQLIQLVFNPIILEADLDIKNYCYLLKSIKEYTFDLHLNETNQIIVEKINNIPELNERDFKFYTNTPITGWLLFLILPIGIIIWGIYYIKISDITEKLNIVKSNLGTIDFILNNLLRN